MGKRLDFICRLIASLYCVAHSCLPACTFDILAVEAEKQFDLSHLVDDPDSWIENRHASAKPLWPENRRWEVDNTPVFQHLCNTVLYGDEGSMPDKVVLDKVYALVVTGKTPHQTLTPDGLPSAPINCHFHPHAAKSSSHKVRVYPRNVDDFKAMAKSKTGIGQFHMLPPSENCHSDNVSPAVLSSLMSLGELLADRYSWLLPQLQQPGEDPVLAACLPQQSAYQSISALLHGLLTEKQFFNVKVRKLEAHSVRGLGSYNWCPALTDIDGFMQQAYQNQHDIFSHPAMVSETLKSIATATPSRHLLLLLSQWLCEAHMLPCREGKCLNVSQAVVQHLMKETAKYNAHLSSTPVFQSYAVSDTHIYLQNLFAWFAEDASQKMMKIDVVDDFFFLKVKTALGLNSESLIVPSSRLIIEQYRKAHAASPARFVKVLLDGKDVTKSVTACHGVKDGDLCGLDMLRAVVKEAEESSLFTICWQGKEGV